MKRQNCQLGRASRLLRCRTWGLALFAVALCVFIPCSSVLAGSVVVLKIDGPIGPVTAMMIDGAIAEAENTGAEALIIELDTPGGLVSTTKEITQSILNANVPVTVFVSPIGASATSAGVFILVSAHFAVMAPGTNVGAAHPVVMQGEMDSTMSRKVENDASANIRALAKRHGRNAAWVERAVRESESITADEALDSNVIDFIAGNLADLLDSLDGRTAELPRGEVTLATAGASINRLEPTLREKVLTVITNPNIAYILMSIGWLGLMMEMYNPGAVFPGVVGAICMILGFYSLQTLPINYAGLGLIVMAIIMFILEVKVVSHGMLTIGGAIAMLIGSLMLIDSTDPAAQISLSVILAVVGSTVAFFAFAVIMALRARLSKPSTGVEGMIGQIGTVREGFETSGMVYVAGEYWQATCSSPITAGAKVRVISMDGMMITVDPVT